MLQRFREFWTNVFAPIANGLLRLGVTPDQVTVVGTLGVVAGALWFFPRGHLLTGVLVITAFVFSDLLDGYMARTSGKASPWGAFLDSTLDRFGDAAIFVGLLLYYLSPHARTTLGEPMLYVYLCLACLVLGSITSYIRAKAESLGMTAKVGIAERAERLAAILIATGLNGIFGLPILTELTLWALALASGITVLQRIAAVRTQALPQD